MKVRYIGENCVSLTNNKIYEVISIEKDWYRIMDDTEEDYLFPPELFDTVEVEGGFLKREISTKVHIIFYVVIGILGVIASFISQSNKIDLFCIFITAGSLEAIGLILTEKWVKLNILFRSLVLFLLVLIQAVIITILI